MNTRDTLIALRQIMRAVDLHSKSLERSAGLTVPQLLILQALDGPEPRSVGELATTVSLSQATTTAVLDRLATKKLVERRRSESDRRRVLVGLTEAGRLKLAEAPSMLQESFVARFDALPSWEQKMLTAALERVADLLNADQRDVSPILQVGEIVPKGGVTPRPAEDGPVRGQSDQ
jgi:DNA-binding MarR family transcriptional regulator